tara:strand:+ start:512 stop:892 length:381 start_codon:yes stop_codon:yes gene_type:complete
MNKIKSKINFKDSRGIISDLIEKENINAVTFITLNKNSVRGNHYHKKTIQWNYILSGKVIFISELNGKKKTLIGNKGELIKLDIKEKHALKGLKKSEFLVFTKGPRGGKEYENDTFRLKKNLFNER